MPSCACEFPPGFGGRLEAVVCATQPAMHETFTQQVQTCASRQGAIQPADDGRAETNTKIDEILNVIVDLQSAQFCRCRDVRVEELQSVDISVGVQRFDDQQVCDLMQFNEVAHDQSLEGAEADMQFGGTAVDMTIVIDMILCDDDRQSQQQRQPHTQ